MKKMTNTMIIAVAVIISFCFASCNNIRGNGDVITIEENMSQFDGLSVHSVFDVTIHHSDTYKVIIEAESNIMPYIITEVKGKTLTLKMKPKVCFNSFKDIRVAVYCKNLEEIQSSGAGNIFAEEIICINKLDISTSGASDIEITKINECKNIKLGISGSGKIKIGNAVCDACDIKLSGAGNCNVNDLITKDLNAVISGAGDISLAGECNSAEVKLSGAGKYSAYDFTTDKYNINISGAGDAMLTVNEELKVRISGVGNVYYYGNPQLDVSTSGVGRVICKN